MANKSNKPKINTNSSKTYNEEKYIDSTLTTFMTGLVAAFLSFIPTVILFKMSYSEEAPLGAWVIYFLLMLFINATILILIHGLILEKCGVKPYYARRSWSLLVFLGVLWIMRSAAYTLNSNYQFENLVIPAFVYIVLYATIATLFTKAKGTRF